MNNVNRMSDRIQEIESELDNTSNEEERAELQAELNWLNYEIEEG
jgi:hypothetical protein